MKIYQTGEPCPCCGRPIPIRDPAELLAFSKLVFKLGLLEWPPQPETRPEEQQ